MRGRCACLRWRGRRDNVSASRHVSILIAKMEFSGDCGVVANAAVVRRRESWEIIVIFFISFEINKVKFFSDMLLSVAKL